jgi:chromate reductase, NAD(P)H dehydrogenase (quinone)
VRILAVSGSLRAGSHNTNLLRAAIDAAPQGIEVELFDPAGIADLPLYDQDLDVAGDVPRSVARLREEWGEADAILFATPEFNGSVPGGLKNAIDWASRPRLEAPLTNKTVAVIGASTGQFGAMWAQADLRKILGIAGARVVGDELPVTRAHEKFDAEGGLLDGELHERLRLLLGTLAAESVPVGVSVSA